MLFRSALAMNRSAEIRASAKAEAQRIAYERGDERADLPRLAAALMHQAMMRELEPYTRMKVRAMATVLTTGYVLHSDGRLEPLPVEIPAVLRPGLDSLDQCIAGIADAYKQAIEAELAPFTPAELVPITSKRRNLPTSPATGV